MWKDEMFNTQGGRLAWERNGGIYIHENEDVNYTKCEALTNQRAATTWKTGGLRLGEPFLNTRGR